MGIGQGIARRLHEAGAAIVIADVEPDAAAATVAELNGRRGGSAISTVTDVGDQSSVQAMVEAAATQFGDIDILVNNAGIYPMVPFADMQAADFERVIRVNLLGVFLCMKAVTTRWIEQGRGGKIINVTSVDALHPSMIGLAHYDASKHAVWGLTKNVALELSQYGITVNALAPGGVATPGTGAGGDVPQEMIEATLGGIPMHRLADPDEMGRVALFLASGLSSYLTGSQVVADGGMLLA